MADVPVWETGWSKHIDREKMTACLRDVASVYTTLGIDFFLAFGSMLGAVRDNDFILWDDDVDLGAFQRDRRKIKEANEILKRLGFYVAEGPTMPKWDEVYIRDGQKIEVWVFEEEGGEYVYDRDRHKHVRYPVTYFDFLVPFKLNGVDVWIPKNAEEMCFQMYGNSWRIPQQGFKCLQFSNA